MRVAKWTIGLLIAATPCFGASGYDTGHGSPTDPFVISTAKQLIDLSVSKALWGKSFRLQNDLDLVSCPNSVGPIGDNTTPFTGTFDGDGKSIRNLTIISPSQTYVGFFGYIRGGRVMNLRLVAPHIEAPEAGPVGALAGDVLSKGEVLNCHVEQANVRGHQMVGGLVANNGGTVSLCSATGNVIGELSVGGLVGFNQQLVTSCCSGASVQATVSHSAYSNTGGLVGENYGAVWDCYADGQVTAERGGGGLVGTNRGRVECCYAAAVVSGKADVGGLIGLNRDGLVYTSYWDMQVSGTTTSAGGTGKTTAQLRDSATFVGWGDKASWTIVQGVDYPRLAWEQAGRETLTGIHSLALLEGQGTSDDPYLIYSTDQLSLVASLSSHWDKHYKLMADLDLAAFSAGTSNTLGNEETPFSGTFDGAGHVLRNLNRVTTSESYLGLFGVLSGQDAIIENLTLVNATVKGSYDVAALVGYLQQGQIVKCSAQGVSASARDCVGALVGRNDGYISQCHAQGTTTGELKEVGGLVGYSLGAIAQCFAIGDARCIGLGEGNKHLGGSEAGGLVGCNEGTIDNCFARCSASADSGCGGLVGVNSHGLVRCCYSSGVVSGFSGLGGFCGRNDGGSIQACFWDVQRSTCTQSDGGVGKTINELKQAATFLDAGWDLVGETENGTENIWLISEGLDYPRFVWEFPNSDL